jgi:Sulfatase
MTGAEAGGAAQPAKAEAAAAPAKPAPAGAPPLWKDALWAYLGLAVLWTFAVAQPLFDLLKDNPEFFAARGSSGFDVISWSVLVVVLPPAVLLGIELLIGLAGRTAREGAHLVLIAGLVTLIAVQALKKSIEASDVILIVLSLLIGAGVAALYARAEPVRSFLRVLSPAPIVFLCLFLFTDPISKVAFPDEAQARTIGGVSNAPIVVVLLDELPSNTLIGNGDKIDAQRFPGFGELARSATWFRNAYTVYDSTERAQPAIMDGNYPAKDKLPTSADHPNSIFSLFGKTYRLNVSEEATTVCSRDLCEDQRLDESYPNRMKSMTEDLGLVWLHVVSPPDIESDLTSVSENWGNFGGASETSPDLGSTGAERSTRANLNGGRATRFEEWIQNIKPSRRPSLNFKHSLMPHVPWQYLPDARRYRRQANDPIPGLSNQAYKWQSQLNVLIQRHALQTGFADHLLQDLWKHLKDEGMWDKSLIVVAADHGVAFPHARERRRLTRESADEIAPIPLLIKAPGQKQGKVDEAWVSTIDILPTIFDTLNLDPRVKMDGKSAYSDEVQNRDTLHMELRGSFEGLDIPASDFVRERQKIIDRNHALLGTGADGPDRIYRIGPHQELLGKSPEQEGLEPLGVDFSYADDYKNVDPSSPFLPNFVVGEVQGGGDGGRDVAVAVNGKIVGVGETFTLAVGDSGELVAVMVPPESFKAGANAVRVYLVP